MDVGFKVGYPEVAKRILGEILEGAKVIEILEVEPNGKVWSTMIDEARTDDRHLCATSDGCTYHGDREGKWLFIFGAD